MVSIPIGENQIVGLRKLRPQSELSGLTLNLRRVTPSWSWPPLLSKIVDDPEDGARLRRLKEIAENNRDHRAALRFSAGENRALRWRETGWFASVIDMMFSGFSDYGQSIWRPVVALIALALVSAKVYHALAKKIRIARYKRFYPRPDTGARHRTRPTSRGLDIVVEQIEGQIARNEGLAPTVERRYGLNPAAGAYR